MKYSRLSWFAARFFEMVSYVFVLFQWLWFGMILAPLFKDSSILDLFLPNGTALPETTTIQQTPSPFLVAVAIVVTIIMIVVSIVALWRLPKSILKGGDAVTHNISEVIVPIATHHKKLPKKKKQLLTNRTIVLVRFIFIALPFIGVVLSPSIADLPQQLDLL